MPVLATLVAVGTGGLVAQSSTADVTASVPTTIVNESFSGESVAGGWVKPGGFVLDDEPADNVACLNAGTDTAVTPIPGCDNDSGLTSALQLTDAQPGEEGAVAWGSSLATTAAIDATFWTQQTGGDGADGLAFFLAASNPASTTSTGIRLGPGGGSLGYAPPIGIDGSGLSNAYFGVGLDAYGNFDTLDSETAGCEKAGEYAPEQVDVRGPGNGASGYCILKTATVTDGSSLRYVPAEALTRTAAADTAVTDPFGGGGVPVEVVVNPTEADITTASGKTVGAGKYLIAFTPIGSENEETISDNLPADTLLPEGWTDDNGVPKRLTFGWSAATGESDDYHLLRNVNVTTIASHATSLGFVQQPIDTEVGQEMVNADNTERHVQVAAFLADGETVDSTYDGTVTLAFADNPGSAKFADDGDGLTTITAQAIDGVADFAPIIVTETGFGYTLKATSGELTDATSDPFNVSSDAAPCPSGETCTSTTSNPGTGERATIKAGDGDSDTVITATYGGNVEPIIGCKKSPVDDILTFSGNRPKTIVLKIPADRSKFPVTLFCYGQPTPFVTLNGKTARFNPANNDYEGFLPVCALLSTPGPCIQSIIWRPHKGERAVILSATNDPHLVH
jgi:hypothetical protein